MHPVQVKEPTGTIGRALPGEEVRDSRSATDRGSSRDATGQGTTTIDGVFADVDGPDDDWTETDTPPSDGTIPGNQRSQEVATGGSGLEIRLTDGSTTTINWDGLSDRSSDSKLKVKDVN